MVSRGRVRFLGTVFVVVCVVYSLLVSLERVDAVSCGKVPVCLLKILLLRGIHVVRRVCDCKLHKSRYSVVWETHLMRRR